MRIHLREFVLDVEPDTQIEEVFERVLSLVDPRREGGSLRYIYFDLPAGTIRFGSWIGCQKPAGTLADHGINDGARGGFQYVSRAAAVARLRLDIDIGVFVSEEDGASPNNNDMTSHWLRNPELPLAAPAPGDVAALVRAVSKAAPPDPSIALAPLTADADVLTLAHRKALMQYVDDARDAALGAATASAEVSLESAANAPPPSAAAAALVAGLRAGSRPDDFKALMAPASLRALIGGAAFDAIVRALGGEPHAVAVRRTAATGRWIEWHVDAARRTVQVPLSDDAACVGGRLVFVDGGGGGGELRLRTVARRAGAVLAHDGDAVHGVTRLVAGTRYGLFALRARDSEK